MYLSHMLPPMLRCRKESLGFDSRLFYPYCCEVIASQTDFHFLYSFFMRFTSYPSFACIYISILLRRKRRLSRDSSHSLIRFSFSLSLTFSHHLFTCVSQRLCYGARACFRDQEQMRLSFGSFVLSCSYFRTYIIQTVPSSSFLSSTLPLSSILLFFSPNHHRPSFFLSFLHTTICSTFSSHQVAAMVPPIVSNVHCSIGH